MEKDAVFKNIGITVVAAIGGYLFLRFVLPLILPFVIAFVIAYVLQPAVRLLSERTGIKRRVISAVLVVLALLLCGYIVFLIAGRLINEGERFAYAISANSGRYVENFFAILDGVAAKLPFIDAVGADLSDAVAGAVSNMVTEAASRLPGFIAGIIGMLPSILLFTVILIMASYYFCADLEKGINDLKALMSPKVVEAVSKFKERLTSSGLSYLRACLIILVITFAELLVGFLMLDIPYAFMLAFIIAAVDMLPILGAGTALIPWSIWLWITGDSYTAIGLLLINLTVTVVRRFIEPRIIGSGIGLSPLTTLFAMYLGFKLFGFTGLFFSPLVAVIILQMLPERIAKRFGGADDEKNASEKDKILVFGKRKAQNARR